MRSGTVELMRLKELSYEFGKCFGEGDYVACGQMMILPGGEKPLKNAKANTMMFHMVSGSGLLVTVNDTAFEVRRDDQFMVPRGVLPCEERYAGC